MKNVLHKKNWNAAVAEQNVDPPLTPPIKNNQNDKLDKDFVKL